MSNPSASVNYSFIVPSFSSIKEGIRAAANSMFSLLTKYIATPAEHYLIGDFRKFSGLHEIDVSSGFAYHSFGLLGSVAKWRPKSKEEMAATLNALDTQPNARSNYRAPQVLINSSPFLLADTSILATPHRKEISRFLTPSKYVSLTWDLYKQQKARGLLIDKSDLAMQAIAKGLLGIELDEECECYLLRELARAFKKYSAIPISASLLKFSPEFRKEQREYQQCIEQLLQREIQKIKNSNTENTERDQGLLAQEVIKKMRQNPNCKDLHKDPDLKSLILLLLALDNLNDAFMSIGYDDLTKSFEKYAIEVDSTKVVQDQMTINSSVLMDREKMPVLDHLYQQCIDSRDQVILGRYVQNGLQCGEHRVPPHTYLAITAPIENPSPLNAFSAGRRSCPGRFVAEAIFKTLIVAQIYHLSPSSRDSLKHRYAKEPDKIYLYMRACEEFLRL